MKSLALFLVTFPCLAVARCADSSRPAVRPRLHSGTDGGKFNLGDTEAEPGCYLAMTQDSAGAIHLISSRNYYAFNLAWIRQGTTVPL